ncbi:MAG: ribonuclease III [Patescibacteria group bacterium]|nr:ribonuclease III [Patescibacteria group bacterium]
MKKYNLLEKQLNIKFKQDFLLIQALTHRSYLNENNNFELNHNERLEFLGDAVLELIVTEFLFKKYDNPEGDLTNWRSSLVNSKMLAQVANKLKINDFLLLGRGEAKDKNSKARESILANAMEALIGAIYLDQGIKIVSQFIQKNILIELPYILKNKLYIDPKTRLQEITQEKFEITPSYKIIQEHGPDHAKKFEMGVYLKNFLMAQAIGSSKQEAEVQAAEKALKKQAWQNYI